jgi:hypothetical protein
MLGNVDAEMKVCEISEFSQSALGSGVQHSCVAEQRDEMQVGSDKTSARQQCRGVHHLRRELKLTSALCDKLKYCSRTRYTFQ